MDISEDIEDESPCFIVPDSQASESGNALVLKGLMMLQPSDLENTGSGNSTDSVMPLSSSSEAQSHDTSPSFSSKDSSSSEAPKEQPLYMTRTERTDKNSTLHNMFRTSTPMVQGNGSSYQQMSEQVACHVTPLEHTPATCCTSQVEHREVYKAKEMSSSDDFISPTSTQETSAEEKDKRDIQDDMSSEEQAKTTSDESKSTDQEDKVSSEHEINKQRDEHEETTSFQCLQVSRECSKLVIPETSSSDDVISPSLELIVPGTPENQIGEVNQKKPVDKKAAEAEAVMMTCEEEQSTSDDKTRTASTSNLPGWQQQILTRPDTASPVISTLTRTTSDISTSSSREISTQESSLHQWQSSGSDDMFQADDNLDSENLQASSVPQHPVYQGLSLPELSQDIFRHKSNGITTEMPGQHIRHGADDRAMVESLETDQPEPSPTDDVILPSQDDVFSLHLTQSQSSAVASQTQPDRQTSLIVTQRTMDTDRNTKIVDNTTSPLASWSNTVLPQTPRDHPSTTGHQEIGKTTDTEPSTSPKLTTTFVGNISDQLPSTSELEAESKMNESTESMESGLVGFHFSPPAMLLKPVPRTTPPCLETSPETIQDLSQEIICSGDFGPTSPDLIPCVADVETTVPVTTLSLSVPTLGDANTDGDCEELEFNLQKDVLLPDVDKIATLSTPSARSVFTNVRERYQPARANLPDDGVDPFEFRDEVYTSPLRKRNRNTGVGPREEERPGAKKRKNRVDDTGECGVNRGKEDQGRRNDNTKSHLTETAQRSNRERFWKVVKTKIITTTTTMVETETEVSYADQDGAVVTKETKHEFSEPTYKTTKNENETREEVDVIPGQITLIIVRDTEETARSHVETPMSNSKRPNATSTTSRDTSIETRLNHDCVLRSSAQSTRDKGKTDITPVIEISPVASTPSTISSPLFPEPCSSTSDNPAGKISSNEGSTRDGRAEKISSTERNIVSAPEKQTTDDAPSLPKGKRKRSLSVDKQRTSRRCSKSSRGVPLRVLHEGTRVLALWCDKHYYPGHVAFKCGNDTKYLIQFDDGAQGDIRDQCIIVVEYLPSDQPVMFCERTGSDYVEGFIRGFYKNGDKIGYKVVGQDNRIVRCPRSDVILSTEQAAIFLSLRDSKITEDNASSASLDSSPLSSNKEPRQNEVPKVLRRSREQSTKKSRSSCHEDVSKGPLSNRDTNSKREAQKRLGKKGGNIGNTEKHGSTKKQVESGRKHRNSSASETPKSSHKSNGKKTRSPTGKVMDKSGVKDVDVYVNRVRRRLSTAMKSTSNKANLIPTRKSPRKLGSRVGIGGSNVNLILSTNKDLFRGYGFLLTGNDVTCAPGDENSPEEEEQVFIRDQVSLQITKGGGEVLKTFPEHFQNDSFFLLSNVCQTTAKYFNALVLGVPCLSHAWVRDCCIENRLVSYKNYLLPAGRDLITERFVEEQDYGNSLQGLKVHLVGDDNFQKQWTEVLKAARCEIIQKLPTNILQKLQYGENDFVCDVIVVGSDHVSHSTIQKARLLSIPTASIHWVKQCILTGRRVDFNAHESFIYRVQRK